MSFKLIDTHCHLTDGRLARQLEGVLARAGSAGVAAVGRAASRVADSAAAAEIADRYEQVHWMAGVHPHEAKDAGPDDLARIEQLAARARNVAIGEIGLDYHYDFSPRDVQRRLFAGQLELARRLEKPIVLHSREALGETLSILSEVGPPGESVLLHSFTGPPGDLRRVLELGAYVSFNGIATFKNSGNLRRAAALVPTERILLETDAPYLSPEPVRKMKVNEPANVVHVLRCLAAARQTTPEALAEQTTANARRLFGL